MASAAAAAAAAWALPSSSSSSSTSASSLSLRNPRSAPRRAPPSLLPVLASLPPFSQDHAISSLPTASTLAAAAASAILLTSPSFPPPAAAVDAGFYQYYGTAASASSYGGYGGNANKRDTAEYMYEVPEGWKERLISKVEKGTNGTDSEFFNPRRRSEKVYLTFLPGFRKLAPRDTVLGNLSLSDVNLQDILSSADDIQASDRTDPASGQLYYDFEISSPVAHALISVTCAKNKLYAHFVNAPPSEWPTDAPILRHIHSSFATVGAPPLSEAGV